MEDLRRMRSELQRPAAASNYSKTISDDLLLRPHGGFADVFGGGPRTILSHKLSATGGFYDDIFWLPEKAATPPPPRQSGRNLPLFDIPSMKQISIDRCSRQKNGFFSDIFRWDSMKMRSSRSRSKTNSSSALSSEELSPLCPTISDDGYDDVPFLASKLRPINVKNKWNSARTGHEDHQKQQKSPLFSDKKPNFDSENEFLDKLWGCPFQENTIEESVDLEHMNFRVSENDDVQFNSPSSAVSSDRNAETSEIIDEIEVDDVDEDDDLMSSYVIELDSCGSRETTFESNDVDEAIAWAKEKFQKHCSQEKSTQVMLGEYQISSEGPNPTSPLAIEDETSILDEKIKLWLTGKEADVRLLLSSLHHILWPNSGWIAIPLMKLIESSQVKKAYQKSVLCLHPDKLQQRGATLLHKYIAEKAFAALQDAWTAFVAVDVSCH